MEIRFNKLVKEVASRQMTDTSKRNHSVSLNLKARAELKFAHSSFSPGNQLLTAFLYTSNGKAKGRLDGFFLRHPDDAPSPCKHFSTLKFYIYSGHRFWKGRLRRNTQLTAFTQKQPRMETVLRRPKGLAKYLIRRHLYQDNKVMEI